MKTIIAILALFCFLASNTNAANGILKFDVAWSPLITQFEGGQGQGGEIDLGTIEVSNWKVPVSGFPKTDGSGDRVNCWVEGTYGADINLSCTAVCEDWIISLFFLNSTSGTIIPTLTGSDYTFGGTLGIGCADPDDNGKFRFTVGVDKITFGSLPAFEAKIIVVTCTSTYI